MNRYGWKGLGLAATAVLAAPVVAQEQAQAGLEAADAATGQVVGREARLALERMTRYLKGLDRFEITMQGSRDQVLPFGYKLQNNETARLAACCLAIVSAGLLLPDIAEAQRRGGGGGGMRGGGGMAHGSISGANRASQQAAMSRRGGASTGTRPSSRPAQGRANGGNTGNINTGNINTGNVNTGNVNTGNVNRGNINTGNINTGDINIDRNVNVDVDHDGWGNWHDVDVDVDGGPGDWAIDVDVDHYHPVATAAAIATTAAVVGSYYYAVPTGCPIVYTYPQPYYYCGGIYYQRQMQGDTVVYVVVKP